MEKFRYNVEMLTPIGIRKGTMTVTISPDGVSGFLNLMKHSEPFSGTIAEDGTCRITGRMISLLRTIEYDAVGLIREEEVQFALMDGRNVYHLTGTSDGKDKEEDT